MSSQSDDEALLALFRKLLGSAARPDAPDPPDVDPDPPDPDPSDIDHVRAIFRTTKENQ